MKDTFCTSGSSPGSIQNQLDFSVSGDVGSIFLLKPLSQSAHAWLEDNSDAAGGFQPYRPTVVVEHRYIANIVDGIQDAGLAVTRG